MRLTPNQKQIVDYLKGGDWKCMANADFFMKDDRTRISELNDLGFIIIGKPCDGRCNKTHNSRLFMRQMTKDVSNEEYVTPKARSQGGQPFFVTATLGPAGTCKPDKPCFSRQRFKVCSCPVDVKKENVLF